MEVDSDEEEHEDEEQQGKAAKPFNPFDLLSDDEVRAACCTIRHTCCSHAPSASLVLCMLVVP